MRSPRRAVSRRKRACRTSLHLIPVQVLTPGLLCPTRRRLTQSQHTKKTLDSAADLIVALARDLAHPSAVSPTVTATILTETSAVTSVEVAHMAVSALARPLDVITSLLFKPSMVVAVVLAHLLLLTTLR